MSLTVKAARAILAKTGYTISYKDGEYRVNTCGGKESTAYYTNDIEDAVATAQTQSRIDAGTHGHRERLRTMGATDTHVIVEYRNTEGRKRNIYIPMEDARKFGGALLALTDE